MMFYGAGVISAFLFGPKTTLHDVDESRVQIEKKKNHIPQTPGSCINPMKKSITSQILI